MTGKAQGLRQINTRLASGIDALRIQGVAAAPMKPVGECRLSPGGKPDVSRLTEMTCRKCAL